MSAIHSTADQGGGHCQVGRFGRAVAGCGHDDIAEPVSRLPVPARDTPALQAYLFSFVMALAGECRPVLSPLSFLPYLR